MANGKFVAYFRVSTASQGASGLGLEAQRASVMSYLNGGAWQLLAEFTEIESGKVNARPQLAAAMAHCRMTGAKLVIAKLDRLSRDAHFLLGLEKAGIEFVAADMPNANRLTVGIMAVVAEEERRMISARTRAALAAAKARGTVLGGWRGGQAPDAAKARAGATAKANTHAAMVAPTIRSLQAAGKSLRAIAAELTGMGVTTPQGAAWTAAAVSRAAGRAAG